MNNVKICPQCGKTAKTALEIEMMFGYRNVKVNGKNYYMPQSWCKDCRGKRGKRKNESI